MAQPWRAWEILQVQVDPVIGLFDLLESCFFGMTNSSIS